MAICFKNDFGVPARNSQFSGTLTTEQTGVNFISVSNEIRADILTLPPYEEPWNAFVFYRLFFKSEVIEPEAVQVFNGAVPRYKLGRYTMANSDYFYPPTYLSYIKQASDLFQCLISTSEYPTELDFFPCTTVEDGRTFRGVNQNAQGQNGTDWNYATDVVFDPEIGVEGTVQIAYYGWVQAGEFRGSVPSYVILNF